MPLATYLKKLHTVGPLVILLSCASVISAHAKKCNPSPLAHREAIELLSSIPQALEAEKAGGKISLVAWSPPNETFHTDKFYFFELLSTQSTSTTPLNNGVIGYYGVNKLTGEVVELNSEKGFVQGQRLATKQRLIRKRHCISPEVVAKNHMPMERN